MMWSHWSIPLSLLISVVFGAPTINSPNGYLQEACLENAAINAPSDCNGDNTYMGLKVYATGSFDTNLCAAACTAQSAYNLRHPPATGKPKTCQFFNTYLLYKNGVNYEQHCALYSQFWDKSYATNIGYHSGSDKYTIVSSYTFNNETNQGIPVCGYPSSSSINTVTRTSSATTSETSLTQPSSTTIVTVSDPPKPCETSSVFTTDPSSTESVSLSIVTSSSISSDTSSSVSSVSTSSSSTEIVTVTDPPFPTETSSSVSSTTYTSSGEISTDSSTSTSTFAPSTTDSSSSSLVESITTSSAPVDASTTSSTTSSITPTPTWILNGGFESTDNSGAPWEVPSNSPTGCTWEIVESTDAVNGTHFAIVTCYNAGEGIYIRQPFQSLDTGATYVVSVYFRKLTGSSDSAGFGCQLGVENGPGLLTSSNLTPYSPWNKQTNTFKATTTETGILISCGRAANGGSPNGVAAYTYIDSIDVYRIPDRPAILINGGLETSASSYTPWYIDTDTTRTTSTAGTIAVAQTDSTNAAYNGTNYLAVSIPAASTSTTLYFGIPIAVTGPIRYLISYYTRSPSAGSVNLSCRIFVANNDFSKSANIVASQSLVASATWAQKTNLRFQAVGWETRLVFACTRGIAMPDIVGQYFIDDLVMTEYGP